MGKVPKRPWLSIPHCGVEQGVEVALDGADDRGVQYDRVLLLAVLIGVGDAKALGVADVDLDRPDLPGPLHIVQDVVLDVDRPVVVDALGIEMDEHGFVMRLHEPHEHGLVHARRLPCWRGSPASHSRGRASPLPRICGRPSARTSPRTPGCRDR